MTKGTTLHYRFNRRRNALKLVAEVQEFFSTRCSNEIVDDANGRVTFLTEGRASEELTLEEAAKRRLERIVLVKLIFEVQARGLRYTVTLCESLSLDVYLDSGVLGLVLDVEPDFWPDSFSVLGRFSLEDTIHDYNLAKDLFRFLDADQCLGSLKGDYCEVNAPYVDRVLRFTKEGPQKLIRPFEEGRSPGEIADGGGDGSLDFEIDPETRLPRWSWVVNKPFREL